MTQVEVTRGTTVAVAVVLALLRAFPNPAAAVIVAAVVVVGQHHRPPSSQPHSLRRSLDTVHAQQQRKKGKRWSNFVMRGEPCLPQPVHPLQLARPLSLPHHSARAPPLSSLLLLMLTLFQLLFLPLIHAELGGRVRHGSTPAASRTLTDLSSGIRRVALRRASAQWCWWCWRVCARRCRVRHPAEPRCPPHEQPRAPTARHRQLQRRRPPLPDESVGTPCPA